MAACKECDECQGTPISSNCVEIQKGSIKNLSCFVSDTTTKLDGLLKPHIIDIKTLSTNKKLSRDEIIQVLIDEMINLKTKVCNLEQELINCNCHGASTPNC
jgi:hypothetical protein